MNQIVSALVAVFATAVVAGLALYGVSLLLGEWAVLMWCAIGFFGFMAVMAKVNS